MVRIAIVEDNDDDAGKIEEYLSKYAEDNGLEFRTRRYSDAESFMCSGKDYDIIFMDIMMKGLDGMSAAKLIRESKIDAALVFVTNMVQYAIEGYSVNALDFMAKPLNYYNFALKMDRIYEYVHGRMKKEIIVSSKTSKTVILISEIKYIEVANHTVTYHTKESKITSSGSLKEVVQVLDGNTFCLCNQCYLVNLNCVKRVNGNDLLLNDGTILQISLPKRKNFMKQLAYFYGRGGGERR